MGETALTAPTRFWFSGFEKGSIRKFTLPVPAEENLAKLPIIHIKKCMKTITINVSESVYRDFQQFGRKVGRKASDLIREAMELYRQQHVQRRTSLRDRRPASVGGPIRPIASEDDLLGEMLNDARD